MGRYKYKVHWYWFDPAKGRSYRTACGKRLAKCNVTNLPSEITCKTCKAVVYGRQEKPTT